MPTTARIPAKAAKITFRIIVLTSFFLFQVFRFFISLFGLISY